jgi:hypothetical protein
LPTYLVEVYLPRSRAAEARVAASRVQAAADQLSREGVPVRYVRTTVLPDDETCFHLIEAPTSAAAEEVSRRGCAGLCPDYGCDRAVPTRASARHTLSSHSRLARCGFRSVMLVRQTSFK